MLEWEYRNGTTDLLETVIINEFWTMSMNESTECKTIFETRGRGEREGGRGRGEKKLDNYNKYKMSQLVSHKSPPPLTHTHTHTHTPPPPSIESFNLAIYAIEDSVHVYSKEK